MTGWVEGVLGFVLIAIAACIGIGIVWLIASEIAESLTSDKPSPFHHFKERFRGVMTKCETYQVMRVHYKEDQEYGYNNLIYIIDDNVRVPVTCPKQEKGKIRQLQRLNPKMEIYIKAKVDRGKLELINVKGYTVK